MLRDSTPGSPDGRVFELFGGVNGRSAPWFPFCIEDAELLSFRLTGLFTVRLPERVPAPGFCAVPPVFMPRATPDSPPFVRPPAEIEDTWFCCIVCRRLAVCC